MQEVFSARLLSSLVKVFPDEEPQAREFTSGTALLDEVYSFQMAYCFSERTLGTLQITCTGMENVEVRDVVSVPVMESIWKDHDSDVLRGKPGLYPDLLDSMSGNYVHAAQIWHSAWFTVQCSKPGVYHIRITASVEGKAVAEKTFSLCVIGVSLSAQKLLCNLGFHGDGLISYYHIRPWTEHFWSLFEKYISSAAEHGMNCITLPVVTPPADTEVGKERPTVQLTDIETDGRHYTFTFDKLRRWVSICRQHGIDNFEVCCLYTQWGAQAAPKVMARDKRTGKMRRIFGWETDAASEKYREFLGEFVPALQKVLIEEGLQGKTLFHISDEPNLHDLERYRKVGGYLKGLVCDWPVSDAAFDIRFVKEGGIDYPIAPIDLIDPFLDNGINNLFGYYCCAQTSEVANRFMCYPSRRNRIIGTQLFKYKLKGFHQWGFNFYNSCLSRRALDPYRETDAGEAFPSGDAFAVYPGPDGPLSSIRLEVFREGMQDLRALELAEELCGREKVLKLIEEGIEPITFKAYPRTDEWMLDMRQRLNLMIEEASNI